MRHGGVFGRSGLLVGAALLAVGASGCGGAGPRAGQIIFVPAGAEPAGVESVAAAEAGADAGQLTVTACEVRERGLAVTGHIADAESVTVVGVSGGAQEVAGARVGRNARLDTGFGESGDFVVVLAWAGLESVFFLVSEGQPITGSGVRCPH